MGADIRGAGTDTVKVNGVEKLHGGCYTIIPDQIEAGTYMVAAAATGGEVLVKNVIPKHLECISAKLRETGTIVQEYEDSVLVKGASTLRKANIKTLPYPGFPTDMQPQMGVLLCIAKGTSVITEGIYDNRFKYVNELRKMGAEVQVDGRVAVFEGGTKLTGAPVLACDLRAGAAMVIAGLCASGVTEVEDIHYIERGYENFVGKLKALGARLPGYAGKISADAKTLLEYQRLGEDISLLLDSLANYAQRKSDEDTRNPVYQDLTGKLTKVWVTLQMLQRFLHAEPFHVLRKVLRHIRR